MGNVNYERLIAGALLAAVFYFIADGLFTARCWGTITWRQ
jgi:hypothetical protein